MFSTRVQRLLLMTTSAATAALPSCSTSCFCGAVRVKIADAAIPQSVSVCHCEVCRKLTGAPNLANLILPVDAVSVVAADGESVPDLVEMQTSKHVTRRRCAKCYSPVSATLGKGRVVVPLSLFPPPHPASWQPQHHLYYDRRVIDLHDSLPKYRTHFGSALWDGEPAEAST